MKIPKRFKLYGQTVHVIVDDEDVNPRDAYGISADGLNQIKLASRFSLDGRWEKIPKDSMESTFCHELVHQILCKMSEWDLNKNEKFVDTFGLLLHQYMTTQEFK